LFEHEKNPVDGAKLSVLLGRKSDSSRVSTIGHNGLCPLNFLIKTIIYRRRDGINLPMCVSKERRLFRLKAVGMLGSN